MQNTLAGSHPKITGRILLHAVKCGFVPKGTIVLYYVPIDVLPLQKIAVTCSDQQIVFIIVKIDTLRSDRCFEQAVME